MSRHLAPFALAVLVSTAIPAMSTAAYAESAGTGPIERFSGSLFDTTMDLGFDVSGVPHDPADVKAFILALPAGWAPKVLAACGHFLAQPNEIKSPETYAFCSNAYKS